MSRLILLARLTLFMVFAASSAMAVPQTQGGPPEQLWQGTNAAVGTPVPPELTLPQGTLVTIRTTRMISSDSNLPGDSFTAVLEQPLVAQGWVVARRSQTVMGHVTAAQKAGRVSGVSQLTIELSELTLVDGRQMPVQTQLIKSSAGTSRAMDAVAVGTTTGIGATIGAAGGGGEGAAIGAAAGAAAGLAGVLSTRGRATEIPPESVITFRLEKPISINTLQNQHAFQPVTSQDYANNDTPRTTEQYKPRIYVAPPPYFAPPPYYAPPYNYCYGCYTGPYFGYYGGFYFGPRIYVGPGRYYRPYYGHRR